jgi:GTP-binding protein Era
MEPLPTTAELKFDTKTIIVTILGKPNAGKSTLMNLLIDYRLSIITPKVQTTRNIIKGIITKGNTQFIFLDTPGIFEPKNSLEKLIVKHAWDSLKGVDAIILLLDGTKNIDDETIALCHKIKNMSNVIVAINKIDISSKIEEIKQSIAELLPKAPLFLISALQNQGIDELLNYLDSKALEGPWLYDEDMASNLPLKFLTAEITREQLFLQLDQELPYNLTVHTESMEDKGNKEYIIKQVIVVSKDNHKKIVLGKNGSRIKLVGQEARKCMELYLGLKVHLFLFVSVKNWLAKPDLFISS